MSMNRVYLTFQGEQAIISTDRGGQIVLDLQQAISLYEKLGDAFSHLPPAAAPDVTLAPTDCVRCEVKE